MDRLVDFCLGSIAHITIGVFTGLAFNPWAMLLTLVASQLAGSFLRGGFNDFSIPELPRESEWEIPIVHPMY